MDMTLVDVLDRINKSDILFTKYNNSLNNLYGYQFLESDSVLRDDYLYISDLDTFDFNCSNIPKNLILVDSNKNLKDLDIYNVKWSNIAILDSTIKLHRLANILSGYFAGNLEIIERPAALFDTIIKGRGIPYIIKIAGDLLGNPVLLGDANHRLLASSNFKEIDDESWMEYRRVGYPTFDFTQKYGFQECIDKSVTGKKPIICSINDKKAYKRIFSTVVVDNRVIGHLAVLEYNRKFVDKDLEITEIICKILSSEMGGSFFKNSSNIVAGRLLMDLLQENDFNEQDIKEQVESLNINIPDKIKFISIKFNDYSDSFPLISFLRERTNKLKIITDILIFKGYLIFLVEESSFWGSNIKDNPLLILIKELHLECGISLVFNNLFNLKKYFNQSIKSIDIGKKFNNEQYFFQYGNYSTVDLIFEMDRVVDLNDYIHPYVLQLKEYDQQHNTEYSKTLKVYIKHLGNIVLSAEALFIHRNTMSYRITKIQEIVPIKLNDDDQITSIYFSYKLLEYLKKNK